jgi:hypothetical protein
VPAAVLERRSAREPVLAAVLAWQWAQAQAAEVQQRPC